MRPNEKPPPWSRGDGLENEQSLAGQPLDHNHSEPRFGFKLIEVWASDIEEAIHGPRLPRERLQHLARSIHRLGERPLYELLAELAAGAPLIPRLERYARLEGLGDFIEAWGGCDLPAARPVDEDPWRGNRR